MSGRLAPNLSRARAKPTKALKQDSLQGSTPLTWYIRVARRLSRLQVSASAGATGSSRGRQVNARLQSSNKKSRPCQEGKQNSRAAEGEAEGTASKYLG